MDSLTQAVLGATIQAACLGREQGRRALAYGAVLATLPDMDVVIRYADPVSTMTYHRGFSHSVFVLTALAALLAWLIRRRWPAAPYSGLRLFATLWLVLVTHPILDAFTVYGTQLFWPLTPTPASWAAVFIIDPVYTLPLLGAVGVSIVRGPSHPSSLANVLAFTTAYLFFGLGSRLYVEHRVHDALTAQGVAVTQLRGVPMPFNTLLWRVIAKTPEGRSIEAVASVFDRGPPEWIYQPLGQNFATVLADVPLHQRLRWFTDDWLRYDAVGDALVVSDLRMGSAGYYTFRFKMATCQADGRWAPVTPESWESPRPAWPQLQLMFARIVQQAPPLPLAAWADELAAKEKAGAVCPA
jgi:inner membrane protein